MNNEARAPVTCVTCGLEINDPLENIRRPARNVETGEFGFVYEHVSCAIKRRREYDRHRAKVIRRAQVKLVVSLLLVAVAALALWMLHVRF